MKIIDIIAGLVIGRPDRTGRGLLPYSKGEEHRHLPASKVLHVIIGLDVGGAELVLKRLITLHINNPRYSHTVVSLTDVGEVGQQLRKLGIEVIGIGFVHLGLNSIFQLPWKFFYLIKLIRHHRPDIVQTWMYHADLVGGLAARLAGCHQVIWGIRNTDVFPGRGVSHFTSWIMKLCAILSGFIPHTILCVGNRAKATHADSGYTLSKMIVISNGYEVETYKSDLDIRHHMRQSLDVPSDALIIGSIGRFNEYKDHRGFVLASANLASTDRRPYFLMVGRDIDSDNITLMKWIEETGYADRFRLLGERNDVPAILNAMDIFCLHSKSEGFPNVLGEAMCAALPSVVTDVGDAGVLLGNAGLVVPPQDVEKLTEGLLTLVQSSPETRAALGNIALKRVKENYSIEGFKRQYEDLYQKVMGGTIEKNIDTLGRIKILHIITHLDQGGAEAVLYRLIEATHQKFNHHVVSLHGEGVYGPMLRKIGIGVETLNIPRGKLKLAGLWQLRQIIRKYNPNLIHTKLYHADLIGGLVAHFTGAPPVIWTVNSSYLGVLKKTWKTRLVRQTCAIFSNWLPTTIIADAENTKRVNVALGYVSKNFITINNGVDLSIFQPDKVARQRLRQELQIQEDVVLLGFIARWDPLKDHSNLLQALSIVKSNNRKFLCVLVGTEMTSQNSVLMEFINKNELDEHIILAGSRSDIPAIMNALDLHVLSSNSESMPLAIIEAMACGTPCVVTDVGDAALVVGDTGWVVPPKEPKALAAGIESAIAALEKKGKDELGQRCRKVVEEKYSLEVMVDSYIKLWRETAADFETKATRKIDKDVVKNFGDE